MKTKTSQTNKFNATRTNGFASKLESDTFDVIKANVPTNCLIGTQVKVVIKPGTERFSSLTWKIDFKVYEDCDNYLYIESKGMACNEFKLKLQLFEFRYPKEFNRLLIVVRNNRSELLRCKQLTVITVAELPECLKAFNNKTFYAWLSKYRAQREN